MVEKRAASKLPAGSAEQAVAGISIQKSVESVGNQFFSVKYLFRLVSAECRRDFDDLLTKVCKF